MLNILYLHHVSAFGGASKSLLTLLSSLKKKGVSATLIAPSGVVADIFENELGIQVVRVLSSPSYSISEHGAYTGRRTVLLYRLFLPLISYLFALIKLRHTQKRFDMIHANEYSMVPAVLLAKLVFGCPVVMHCRSRLTINQRFSTKVVSWLVNRFVHCVISIDSNVHSTVPPHSKNIIIHNAETSFPSLQNIEERYKELKNIRLSRIKNQSVISVGFVGNFLINKGLIEFIEAGMILMQKGYKDRVRFHVFGHISESKRAQISRFALGSKSNSIDMKLIDNILNAKGAHDIYKFHGLVRDSTIIFGQLDLLCFPSRLNAVGRPVFEAASFAVPSLVCMRGVRHDDSITDNVTGFIVEEQDIQGIARSIEELILNPYRSIEMGLAAFEHCAGIFNPDISANSMIHLYHSIIGHKSIENE